MTNTDDRAIDSAQADMLTGSGDAAPPEAIPLGYSPVAEPPFGGRTLPWVFRAVMFSYILSAALFLFRPHLMARYYLDGGLGYLLSIVILAWLACAVRDRLAIGGVMLFALLMASSAATYLARMIYIAIEKMIPSAIIPNLWRNMIAMPVMLFCWAWLWLHLRKLRKQRSLSAAAPSETIMSADDAPEDRARARLFRNAKIAFIIVAVAKPLSYLLQTALAPHISLLFALPGRAAWITVALVAASLLGKGFRPRFSAAVTLLWMINVALNATLDLAGSGLTVSNSSMADKRIALLIFAWKMLEAVAMAFALTFLLRAMVLAKRREPVETAEVHFVDEDEQLPEAAE